jgi:hypothetical protein
MPKYAVYTLKPGVGFNRVNDIIEAKSEQAAIVETAKKEIFACRGAVRYAGTFFTGYTVERGEDALIYFAGLVY